ncbi:MAG: hypothetical protein KKE11_01025, partial [Gammaproteobacteria bacterium]|nr:hypothetical protein [Gammaproteobacteria bacterium]
MDTHLINADFDVFGANGRTPAALVSQQYVNPNNTHREMTGEERRIAHILAGVGGESQEVNTGLNLADDDSVSAGIGRLNIGQDSPSAVLANGDRNVGAGVSDENPVSFFDSLSLDDGQNPDVDQISDALRDIVVVSNEELEIAATQRVLDSFGESSSTTTAAGATDTVEKPEVSAVPGNITASANETATDAVPQPDVTPRRGLFDRVIHPFGGSSSTTTAAGAT